VTAGSNAVVGLALTGTPDDPSTASIRGVVYRSDGATLVAGARVEAVQAGVSVKSEMTGTTGEFVLGGLSPGAGYKIRVAATGSSTRLVGPSAGYTLVAGGTVGPVAVILADPALIRGTVTRGGAPVCGALIQTLASGPGAIGVTVFTDALGRYQIPNLPPASYSVRATPYVVAPSTKGPVTAASGLAVVVDFNL
jgi:hypothetical protein